MVAASLIVLASACGGQSAVAPSTTASPATSSSPTRAAADPAPAATDPAPAGTNSGSAGTGTQAAPPKCVGQGKACTIGDTYCCYGSCRVYNGSATPVCAP